MHVRGLLCGTYTLSFLGCVSLEPPARCSVLLRISTGMADAGEAGGAELDVALKWWDLGRVSPRNRKSDSDWGRSHLWRSSHNQHLLLITCFVSDISSKTVQSCTIESFLEAILGGSLVVPLRGLHGPILGAWLPLTGWRLLFPLPGQFPHSFPDSLSFLGEKPQIESPLCRTGQTRALTEAGLSHHILFPGTGFNLHCFLRTDHLGRARVAAQRSTPGQLGLLQLLALEFNNIQYHSQNNMENRQPAIMPRVTKN